MHVEISTALNFIISYLYNKLPRRRVDLFGEELEVGLKEKFQGHWYPENPSKGSGYRCVKGNGEEVDAVIVMAAMKAGLDISEVKNYLPDDLILWIDPSEVSYKIGEKGLVKLLYSDRREDDGSDNTDREVQVTNRSFNPEAQTFTPESHIFTPESHTFTPESHTFTPESHTFIPESHTFTPDLLAFSPDVTAFCTESSQAFQPIDSLSSSLSNLSLSPSSPVPPGSWSTATSPCTNLFNSVLPNTNIAPPSFLSSPPSSVNRQQFTAAMFAQTKFGSTKLKTHVKRPNRLSPTEFGNFFRQQQRNYAGPQRPRSLSPRDPRVEFLMDQQHRMLLNQRQQQMSVPFSSKLQHQFPQHCQQHQQQFSPKIVCSDFFREHSSGVSSNHSSPHLSPHLSPHISPQSNGPAFQDFIHSNPNLSSFSAFSPEPINRSSSLTQLGRLSGLPSLSKNPMANANSSSHPGQLSQAGFLTPDGTKSFVESLASVNHSNSLQHLLVAN